MLEKAFGKSVLPSDRGYMGEECKNEAVDANNMLSTTTNVKTNTTNAKIM